MVSLTVSRFLDVMASLDMWLKSYKSKSFGLTILIAKHECVMNIHTVTSEISAMVVLGIEVAATSNIIIP